MRWKILAALFVARISMAFQFAAIGALGPLYETHFGIDSAGLGLLIGIYFLPGIVVSLPGGTLAARFGDKRILCLGLALMCTGAAVMAVSSLYGVQLAARIFAGAGGVLLNVSMTKMVADWFAGREIGTAMAVFVNAWPAGVAAALLVLPPLAVAGGTGAASWAVFGLAALGLVLVIAIYRSPPETGTAAPKSVLPRGTALAAILCAGCAWALFNAALGMAFSFGPTNLVERGYPLTEASAVTSILIWCVMAAGIAGGVLADATGRPTALAIVSLSVMTLAMLWFPQAGNVPVALMVLGIATGLPTGFFMTLAAKSLDPAERAMGMGLFYTLYYMIFSVAPYVGGALIEAFGGSAVAFYYGAAMLVATLLCIQGSLVFQRRRAA